MSKKILLISLLLLVLAVPTVSAETNSTTDSARPRLLMERQTIRKEYREIAQEKREEMRAKFASLREEFKTKLGELKDIRKKNTAEHIDLKLSTINKRGTDKLADSIIRLENLLDKFSSRAAKLKAEGHDTAEVDSAIIAARSAIETAKVAVATQAAKEYIPENADESNLKKNFGQQVSSLRHDLKSVFDVVKTAKVKVMDVARALAKLQPEKPTSEPSVAPSPTVVEPTI